MSFFLRFSSMEILSTVVFFRFIPQDFVPSGCAIWLFDAFHHGPNPDPECPRQGRHAQLHDHPGAVQHEAGGPEEFQLLPPGPDTHHRLEHGRKDSRHSQEFATSFDGHEAAEWSGIQRDPLDARRISPGTFCVIPSHFSLQFFLNWILSGPSLLFLGFSPRNRQIDWSVAIPDDHRASWRTRLSARLRSHRRNTQHSRWRPLRKSRSPFTRFRLFSFSCEKINQNRVLDGFSSEVFNQNAKKTDFFLGFSTVLCLHWSTTDCVTNSPVDLLYIFLKKNVQCFFSRILIFIWHISGRYFQVFEWWTEIFLLLRVQLLVCLMFFPL